LVTFSVVAPVFRSAARRSEQGCCVEGFGQQVRARRIAIGLSQSALAAAVSVTRAAIQQIEAGRLRGAKATRERIEAFLSNREQSALTAAAASQWLRNAPR
jgi:transcriptional regulator with XRE-family HTH domain